MEKFLRFLQTTMETPKPYGAFHLIAVAIVLVATFLVCFFFRDANDKTYRNVLIAIWAVMFVFEVFKQLMCSYTIMPDGEFVWEYQWYSFPLQLCSSPLWTLLPVAFLKDGKVRTAISAFMYTYILLGGLATYIFPQTTFCPFVYINVQTLVHHGLQIMSCVYIAVRNRKTLINLRSFFYGFIVFVIAVAIACIFNEVVPLLFHQHVDMFYIGRDSVKTMPVESFDAGWKKMPWFTHVLFYIAALTALAYIIHMVYYGINYYLKQRSKKKAKA